MGRREEGGTCQRSVKGSRPRCGPGSCVAAEEGRGMQPGYLWGRGRVRGAVNGAQDGHKRSRWNGRQKALNNQGTPCNGGLPA